MGTLVLLRCKPLGDYSKGYENEYPQACNCTRILMLVVLTLFTLAYSLHGRCGGCQLEHVPISVEGSMATLGNILRDLSFLSKVLFPISIRQFGFQNPQLLVAHNPTHTFLNRKQC